MGRIRLFGFSRWICAPAIAVVLGMSACSLPGSAPDQGAVADQGRHRLTPVPMPSDAAAALKSVPLMSLAVTPSKRPTGSVDPTLPWLRPGPAGRIRQANLTGSAVAPQTPPMLPKPALAVHLASYGSRAAARRGWDTLRKMYPRLLAAVEPILTAAESGANGPAVRLLAGPFDTESVGSVCRDIRTRGGWCRQVPVPAKQKRL